MATAIAAVVGGAALALAGAGARVLGPLRAFALAAVIATVAGHLLPEAVDGGGALVLVAFAAALAAPGVITRLVSSGAGAAHDHALATELAYVSLLLHKVTDGVALGVAAAPGPSRHWDVIAAIAAHTVPMAAVVALAYRDRPRVAWLRALGLGAAIVAGAVGADLIATTVLADASPWLGAIASGLLLHVVSHDLPAGGARTDADRALELAALAGGAGLPLVFAAETHGMGGAVLAIARVAAPPVLVGLVAGALLQAIGARARGGLAAAVALPGCSCASLPAAIERRREGASLATAATLALAAPALGADALFASCVLLGAPLALVRLAAAIASAACAGAVFGARAGARPVTDDDALLHGPLAHRVSTALDELVTHGAPWLCAGLAAAALLAGALPAGFAPGPLGSAAIALALAVPARVSLAAAIPPAAVLVAAGLPAGAAIAGLALAPLVHPALIAYLRREAGVGRALAALAVGAAIAAACALVPVAARAPLELPRPLADLCLAALALLAVRSLWRFGVAAWIAALHGHGQHGHTHDERHVTDALPPAPHADHHGAHHHHDD
jgi:uncharacterized membrane protein YraQ (UPF0718 family)